MKKLQVPRKDILYRLYVNENKSLATIAAEFSTSAMTVRSWLHSYNIQTRTSFTTIYSDIRNTDFTDKQKSLLIGSILGDGGLRITKRSKNAHFYERHCEKQKSYLEWKRDLLQPFVPRKLDKEVGGKHIISGMDCVVQDSYKMTSIVHSYLTELWLLFYKGNGNKIVPNDIEKYLNLFVIAVWVCDDGSLTWNNIKRSYRIDIHTENFSYEENVLLSRCMSVFFKGNIKIYSRKYRSGTKYYLSLAGKNEVHDFCTLLKSFVPDCMKYKFDTYL